MAPLFRSFTASFSKIFYHFILKTSVYPEVESKEQLVADFRNSFLSICGRIRIPVTRARTDRPNRILAESASYFSVAAWSLKLILGLRAISNLAK